MENKLLEQYDGKLERLRSLGILTERTEEYDSLFPKDDEYTIVFNFKEDFPIVIIANKYEKHSSKIYMAFTRHYIINHSRNTAIFPTAEDLIKELTKHNLTESLKKVIFNLDLFEDLNFYPRYYQGFTVTESVGIGIINPRGLKNLAIYK